MTSGFATTEAIIVQGLSSFGNNRGTERNIFWTFLKAKESCSKSLKVFRAIHNPISFKKKNPIATSVSSVLSSRYKRCFLKICAVREGKRGLTNIAKMIYATVLPSNIIVILIFYLYNLLPNSSKTPSSYQLLRMNKSTDNFHKLTKLLNSFFAARILNCI